MSMIEEIIPKEIIYNKEHEFLPPSLEKLRDHVLETRGLDISIPLGIYELRVEYHQKDFPNEPPISWETLSVFEFETKNNGIIQYKVDKRKIKKFFLIGWMEVNFHKRGKIYTPEDIIKNKNYMNNQDQFFHDESFQFSLEIMTKFGKKYFQSPKKKIFPKCNNNTRHVYVNPDLWYYFYGKHPDEKAAYSKNFFPIQETMYTIRCSENSESMHAAIANFDSCQEYAHVLYDYQGEVKMTKDPKCLSKNSDNKMISLDRIIKKLNSNLSLTRLSPEEQDYLLNSVDEMPVDSYLSRLVKSIKTRESIAKYFYAIENEKSQPLAMKSDKISNYKRLIKNSLMQLYEKFWQPPFAGQLVTASDIPEQEHTFKLADGEIQISCLWRGAYQDLPAFIKVTWKANFSPDFELWIKFVNPDTNDVFSTIKLGNYLEGGKEIPSDILNFDPTKDKWATSVILKGKNQ
jgi:hypothetical protein